MGDYNESWKWVSSYFSKEQMAKIGIRMRSEFPATFQCKREWAGLIREVEAAIAANVSPSSSQARALAQRWNQLSQLFAAGDPAIVATREKIYSDTKLDPGVRALLPSDQVRKFIASASGT